MKITKCKICNSKSKRIIWNDKLREGKSFTKKKYKIFQCLNCRVRYTEKIDLKLNDSSIFRKIYDGANTIKKYQNFNKPREIKKIKYIEKFVDLKNKSVLETNCGAASILDYLQKKKCKTFGQDNIIYKGHLEKKHVYYEKIDKIYGKKFDIILSLAEIEHVHDPIIFLKKLKKLLVHKGKIIIRVPNYENIYLYSIKKDFQKFDFRTSHNFYFCKNSLRYLFKKTKLNIKVEQGFNEYDINHFFHYFKTRRRVKKYKKLFNEKINKTFLKIINEKKLSTSFIYILSKN